LIEAAKIAGLGGHAVAAKYGVSSDAVFRHMRNHVSEEDRAAYIADVPIKELAAQAAAEGVAILDYLAVMRGQYMQQFQLAASLNDRHAMATLGRALVEVLRLQGSLSGELLNASQINITNNTAIFLSSPDFAEMVAGLSHALSDEPTALPKVLAVFERLDAKVRDTKMIEAQPIGGGGSYA
jgi:hypothetical protein